ncbi:MAG: toprim domain-containing protein, partial [Simkania negevensis]|nr:toprim domain-containing protein [Simkania negevensis]
MAIYSKKSLETLKERIDLIEVISPYLELRSAGAFHKGLCPFHEEKTPSFMIQKGSSHYHCFGCGAHQALQYLYNRGIDLNFIQLFHIGYAPRQGDLFEKIMQKDKVSMEELEIVGLIKKGEGNQRKLFFSDRITFPILDPFGNVIGFSARKIKEENFGPKYINTPETPLFKKSSVLYGLSFSRRRIAKEKKAIIVEGQIDALRLIHSGLNLTVAGQGTAFTEEHIKELLHLGITHVYLAFDGDEAGQNAALKVGDIFQKEGVEVSVAVLPQDSDPDTFLNEEGVEGFLQLLEKAPDYLAFAFELLSKNVNLHSPSEKNTLIQMLAKRIRNWDHPLMVHESLRKLAKMTQIPEELVGVGKEEVRQKIFIKKEGSIGEMEVDPDRVLEIDLLRWLFLLGERSSEIIQII